MDILQYSSPIELETFEKQILKVNQLQHPSFKPYIIKRVYSEIYFGGY